MPNAFADRQFLLVSNLFTPRCSLGDFDPEICVTDFVLVGAYG